MYFNLRKLTQEELNKMIPVTLTSYREYISKTEIYLHKSRRKKAEKYNLKFLLKSI